MLLSLPLFGQVCPLFVEQRFLLLVNLFRFFFCNILTRKGSDGVVNHVVDGDYQTMSTVHNVLYKFILFINLIL